MSIDFDKFLHWAESRFDDVRVSGEEIKINSIFCEDRKHHLWCNPLGGKTESQSGVYHCWKSDKKGSLVGLVMIVDNCSFEDALERLDATSGRLEDLERKVQELFNKKESPRPQATEAKGLEMPPFCYLFDDLPSSNKLKREAEEYLASRKIKKDGLLVCTSGRYRNRIVIPYYNKSGLLIYYNGRYVGDPGSNLRYLGPPKELGIGKGDVMYAQRWPSPGEKIYITEGEFDAMSLFQCGFASAALGGKVLSETQMEMIRSYVPVLCLDADKAGGEAMPKIAHHLFSMGFPKVFYVRPCKEFKDWNGLLTEKGEKILRHYVMGQERQYDTSAGGGDWESTKIAMNDMIN
jgi:DNA primase